MLLRFQSFLPIRDELFGVLADGRLEGTCLSCRLLLAQEPSHRFLLALSLLNLLFTLPPLPLPSQALRPLLHPRSQSMILQMLFRHQIHALLLLIHFKPLLLFL